MAGWKGGGGGKKATKSDRVPPDFDDDDGMQLVGREGAKRCSKIDGINTFVHVIPAKKYERMSEKSRDKSCNELI